MGRSAKHKKQNTVKETGLQKLSQKRGFFPLLAFLIPVVISFIICMTDHVYPFGDQCVLHMDMYHQYCPFFTELMNKLKSGSSLLYSWNVGLGSDFFSIFVYYLTSPFNWLLLLCPKAHVIEFMWILIIVKIGLCSLSFFCYLRGHFGLRDDEGCSAAKSVAALVFSCAYAFSGFVAAYSWDIMWMDSVALAPVILLGLERLVREEKPALYYITLALSILCNYYLSIMICIFLVFDFVWLFFTQEEGRIKAFFRFAWYSLLAGGTGVILMLPEMLVLSESGSSGVDFPEKVEWYFNLLSELSRLCVNADVYEGTSHWPNLYAGAFSILFLALYACNRRISIGKRISHLGMVVFLFLSFNCNWLDFIWHGLHFPDSLPGRESFLFIWLLLVMGFECLENLDGVTIGQILFCTVLCAALMLAAAWKTDDEITSLNSGWLTAMFLAFYGVCLLGIRLNNDQKDRFLYGVMGFVAMMELVFNMGVTGFYTTDRTDYTEKTDSYEALLTMAQEDAMEQAGADSEEEVFYRVEHTARKTKNDDALYGYSSGTQFSSLMNIGVSHFYQSVFMEGGKNYYCFNGATPLTAAMLDVQYMISEDPGEEGELLTLVGSDGEEYLYRNNYCLSLGYVLPEETVSEWEASDEKKLEGINTLAHCLGSEEDLLDLADADPVVEEGCTTLTIPADGYYYAKYDTCTSDSINIVHEDGGRTHYSKATHKYLFSLGWCTEGEHVELKNTASEEITFYTYRLNMTAFEKDYATLSDTEFELEKATDTSVTGSVDMKEAGRLIFSIPAEQGWSLLVDGEPCEIQSFDEAFISASLPEGEHSIRLHYQTPGLAAGAAASAACVLLFVISMAVRKRRTHTS